MKLRKSFGVIFMLIGLAMLAGAGWLLYDNYQQDEAAGSFSAEMLESMKQELKIAAPTPAPTPEPQYHTLRRGDQGPEVVTLQQALTELGYLKGAADGNFGTGTMTAVKEFQQAEGLDADGIAGRLTQEALYAKSSVTPIPETTVGPDDIMDLPG